MGAVDKEGERRERWTYSYWRQERDPTSALEESGADRKTLILIQDSLKEMTGGCGICLNREGTLCTIRALPVKESDPRCDSFERKVHYEANEDISKKVIQEYVNGILGIRDPRSVKRLTG
jgi:hypothetical protein